MTERTTKTKAELLNMLAEAVRNTQPQPRINVTQTDPTSDARPKPKRNTRPVSKCTTKTKNTRASAGRTKWSR